MFIPHATQRGLSVSLCVLAASVAAEDASTKQQQEIAALRQQNTQLSARLDALEQRSATPQSVGDRLRLIDISLDILMAAGTSTAKDAEIPNLQGGGHDPSRRGFTFQGAELSLAGAVDPFFTAEAHLVAIRHEPSGETGIEVEEAFAKTTSLPYQLEAKGGIYLTEFGRFNPSHPHSWAFIDQPVIHSRVFGGDGLRGPGVRISYGLPTNWLSEVLVGMQDANGETAQSFLANDEVGAVGGRPYVERDTKNLGSMLTNARWSNGFDVGQDSMMKIGFSGATGPNAAGTNTRTHLWGADVAYKWHPSGGKNGWPFVLVESEYIERAYQVDAVDLSDGAGGSLGQADSATLRDRGIVAQVVYGFYPEWSVGLRAERCVGSGQNIVTQDDGSQTLESRRDDPLRDNRTRMSALIGYQPSEFAHFRLQYNHDRADHSGNPEHSIWFGIEFLIGAHPAHNF